MTLHPAPEIDQSRLEVLHVLRVTGLAPLSAVAGCSGLTEPDAGAALAAAVADGLALERGGRMPGFCLTAEGRVWHATAVVVDAARRGARPALERGYARFVELNQPFKQVCTDWQIRNGELNDHTDAAYDATVLDRLGALHEQVCVLTDELAAWLLRCRSYSQRFTSAWQRLRAGDRRAFAAPMSDSYHDVWMALHQDLMSCLGRERSASDGH